MRKHTEKSGREVEKSILEFAAYFATLLYLTLTNRIFPSYFITRKLSKKSASFCVPNNLFVVD